MSNFTKENPTEEMTEQRSRKRKAEEAIGSTYKEPCVIVDPPAHPAAYPPAHPAAYPPAHPAAHPAPGPDASSSPPRDPDDDLETARRRQYEQQVDESLSVSPSNYQLNLRPENPSCLPYVDPYPEYISLQFRWSSFSPLPYLSWANPDDVWENMIHKDSLYIRDKNYFHWHPELQENMRALLLDWLMEVSEVLKLHRETFHLAQDFLDRFMATQENVKKSKLQLIGITCLFIAAKMEEIYPPRINELVFFADGACTVDEMLSMEQIIMKALNWCLTPITMVSWMNLYLQVAHSKQLRHFLLPQYPQKTYLEIMQLLDLCSLDIESLAFSYRVLAASAIYHCTDPEYLEEMTGFEWTEIDACIRYMLPFVIAITDMGKAKLQYFSGVSVGDMHNIQTHKDYMDMLDHAHYIKQVLNQRDTENHNRNPSPPRTIQKETVDGLV